MPAKQIGIQSLDRIKAFDEAFVNAWVTVQQDHQLSLLDRKRVGNELTLRIRTLLEQGQCNPTRLANEAVAHLRQIEQKRRSLDKAMEEAPN